jgi:hypothetical protein
MLTAHSIVTAVSQIIQYTHKLHTSYRVIQFQSLSNANVMCGNYGQYNHFHGFLYSFFLPVPLILNLKFLKLKAEEALTIKPKLCY